MNVSEVDPGVRKKNGLKILFFRREIVIPKCEKRSFFELSGHESRIFRNMVAENRDVLQTPYYILFEIIRD